MILEDEQDAQELLKSYIEKVSSLHILGIFESGLDVPIDILANTDLLFLDIQLPELNGIQYLKSIETPPKVIITSAYQNFAIEAFDLAVTDYLLKPYSFERFYKSINRVFENQAAPSKSKDTFFVYADKTTHKIKSSDILYIKAEVDYVKIKTVKQEILILDSLKNWNEKLKGQHFAQVHRSYIVNMEKVESISGNQLCIQDAEYLPISSTFKERVLKIFFG
ncbi:MAG: LytTR family DNA-binding domain-containing protein [Chitinophagales bacterium]|nr:LytTR family DNA-binding domain-containing protein [Chitinophagales bacterium]